MPVLDYARIVSSSALTASSGSSPRRDAVVRHGKYLYPPGLRLNLPDTIALSERIRKSTRPNDGLVLNHYSESPGDDSICGGALDIPEAHLVGQVLLGHTKVLTPFLYVSYPLGWRIWVQPAVGRNPVNDDRGVPEHAEEQRVVLRVEGLDVQVD